METETNGASVPRAVVVAATVIGILFMYGYMQAAALLQVRDLISTSAPNATSTHAIQFTTTNAVPASGKITITPAAGYFSIPAAFDYTDVDFAIASGGPYTERELAASANATDDGVTVVSGTSGSITITLNSTTGIAAGEQVRVLLGTNATHATAGDQMITNPSSAGSYRIQLYTQNASSVNIDGAQAVAVIVTPVTLSVSNPNEAAGRSNGLPSGTVAANNSSIEISLETNEIAACRFATSTGVLYDNMTSTFSSNAGAQIHFATVAGHQNDTTYSYYVRCADIYNKKNEDDYEITFALDETPISETSIPLFGTDGTGGTGPFPGGSSVLFLASVTLSGWSSPQSTITILRDGKSVGTTQARSDGSFSASIAGMERGTYTFFTYSTDRARRKSASYSATLFLNSGTNNTLSNIVVPPTIGAEETSIGVGESAVIIGEGKPGSTIEVYATPPKDSRDGIKTYTTTAEKGVAAATEGTWSVTVPARDLSKGTYTIRARAFATEQAISDLSSAIYIGVGENPSPDLANRADINKDGKVNLVDFSIMLSFWGTDDGDADINLDGNVNLADFSILLFNWTG